MKDLSSRARARWTAEHRTLYRSSRNRYGLGNGLRGIGCVETEKLVRQMTRQSEDLLWKSEAKGVCLCSELSLYTSTDAQWSISGLKRPTHGVSATAVQATLPDTNSRTREMEM